ncbi:MAG: AAA family ATPase, partial [Pedobacter sp.]
MHLRYAERRQARIRVLLQGPSGSGKTYSSLLLAYGLTGSWSSIAIIDTENKSADLFEHLGKYRVLVLEPPYTPERYIEALKVCELAGVQVIIIDSLSQEWQHLIDE